MKTFKWGVLVLLAITMLACYPEYNKDLEDYDVVMTIKNSDNFNDDSGQSMYKVYFMPDTVMQLGDSIKEKNDPEFPTEFDSHILSEVAANFNAMGYTRITDTTGIDPSTVDILVTVSSLARTTTVYYASWPGYWWGPGYWGGYWGGGYWGNYWGYNPWYPIYPVWSSYSFDKGSVIIDYIAYDSDATNDPTTNVNEQLKSEWSGVLNGLLYSGNQPTKQRLSDGINEIFAKSPYLTVK